MPIELNKILRDIAEENILKPTANASPQQVENAWIRVSKKSCLSVHETKSIFKVLQKKYEQERLKDTSTWKLFDVMNEIHTPAEESDEEESEISMEENEEYEMLEVDEEQQQEQQENDNDEIKNEQTKPIKSAVQNKSEAQMTSDGESPTKSKSDASHENSPEQAAEKRLEIKKNTMTASQPAGGRDEKKLLNLLLSPTAPRMPKTESNATTAAALALQKKGITLKKANPAQKPPQPSQAQQASGQSVLRNMSESRTIKMPESIKRKLNEENSSTSATATKKILLGQPSGNIKQLSTKPMAPKTLIQSRLSATSGSLLKKEVEERNSKNSNNESPQEKEKNMTANSSNTLTDLSQHNGLNVITVPAATEMKNEANTAVAGGGLKVITLPMEGNDTLLTNGITPIIKNSNTDTNGITATQIDELDFSDHVLISTNNTSNNNNNNANIPNSQMNLANFSNDLPRAFFNNLCNSNRHEAFALYIANVMNRLDTTTAVKLETTIMRALLEAQTEALKQS